MLVGSLINTFPRLKRICDPIARARELYITLLPDRLRYLWSRVQGQSRGTICCYPQYPLPFHTMYRIAAVNRYTLTSTPEKADSIIFFKDTTCHRPDTILQRLHQYRAIINYRCQDIGKHHVDSVHQRVFGYGLTIDPRTYGKPYVKKSTINSLHNYAIQTVPEQPDKAYVYQRVVYNEINKEVIDIRLPIYDKVLPVCTLKYRPVDIRFGDLSTHAEIVQTASVLSPQELQNIERFCTAIGLDCGELDVLRDYQDGRIYVVDVNNTPSSPARALTKKDKKRAIELFAKAFHEVFGIKNLK